MVIKFIKELFQKKIEIPSKRYNKQRYKLVRLHFDRMEYEKYWDEKVLDIGLENISESDLREEKRRETIEAMYKLHEVLVQDCKDLSIYLNKLRRKNEIID